MLSRLRLCRAAASLTRAEHPYVAQTSSSSVVCTRSYRAYLRRFRLRDYASRRHRLRHLCLSRAVTFRRTSSRRTPRPHTRRCPLPPSSRTRPSDRATKRFESISTRTSSARMAPKTSTGHRSETARTSCSSGSRMQASSSKVVACQLEMVSHLPPLGGTDLVSQHKRPGQALQCSLQHCSRQAQTRCSKGQALRTFPRSPRRQQSNRRPVHNRSSTSDAFGLRCFT